MRAEIGLQAFSQFIGALGEARLHHDGPDLLSWGAAELSRIVGFEAAWCGWADMMPPQVEIIGTQLHNLPTDYVAFWNSIKSDDLLAGDVQAMKYEGRRWASYERDGARHTDGMVALADRYGLRKLSVVTRRVDPLRPQLFLAAYRSGVQARTMNEAELTFLACALDHLQGALDQHRVLDDASLRLLVDAFGRPVAGSAAALELWAGWRNRPEGGGEFGSFLDHCGLRVLTNPAPVAGGHVLTELRIIPQRVSDKLTQREREIAGLISEGHTHAEIARALGLAPATVRNQTARIYEKAGVTSRAALTRALVAGH